MVILGMLLKMRKKLYSFWYRFVGEVIYSSPALLEFKEVRHVKLGKLGCSSL